MKHLAWLLFGALLAGAVFPALAAEKEPDTDDAIYDRVFRRIANDAYLKTTAIEITVRDRVVTLQGLIETEKLRQRLESVVKKTPGVKKVVNEVKVRP